jgi:hypothetical protein
MACGLWLSPDFADTLAGRTEAPRVNHSVVDYSALHAVLTELFPFGPPVKIQVADDTIDQVAVHVREGGLINASIRCEDFGQLLLSRAKNVRGPVIGVRSCWNYLHAIRDRDFAPPPVILPFVVTADDFEDAIIWQASTRPRLGLAMFDPSQSDTKQGMDVSGNGILPDSTRQSLAKIFGTPFEEFAVIDRMAMDAPPREYANILAGERD